MLSALRCSIRPATSSTFHAAPRSLRATSAAAATPSLPPPAPQRAFLRRSPAQPAAAPLHRHSAAVAMATPGGKAASALADTDKVGAFKRVDAAWRSKVEKGGEFEPEGGNGAAVCTHVRAAFMHA
eukprot:358984-Chlamydomonas_euryale.AAC.6